LRERDPDAQSFGAEWMRAQMLDEASGDMSVPGEDESTLDLIRLRARKVWDVGEDKLRGLFMA
jgi:hypothetical protein